MDDLKGAIAGEAASIPSVGRSVPRSWKILLETLQKQGEQDPYISFKQFQSVCRGLNIDDDLGRTYVAILNELGYAIHYQHDEVLKDVVILKPEYISKAISYVLEDGVAKEQSGLISLNRLQGVWNDPKRVERERFPEELHPVFQRLLERFDLSYKVVMPSADDPETSLIAQLVPSCRPEKWNCDWREEPELGDVERTIVCRLVDCETGRPTEVDGLFYRLIVRLHRFSLGKENYQNCVHWQKGMILEDGYNGRALLEEINGDVHITVRAAYPDGFLGILTGEIHWLIEHFWKGLDCRLSVPCHLPCRGLHELEELVETKQRGMHEIRCSACKKFYKIDSLLLAKSTPLPIDVVRTALREIAGDLRQVGANVTKLDTDKREMIGRANEQFQLFMNTLINPAKDGPRLFCFKPRMIGFSDKSNWIEEKFILTLWCEHSRLPLSHPDLNGPDDKMGILRGDSTSQLVEGVRTNLESLVHYAEHYTTDFRLKCEARDGRHVVRLHRGAAGLWQRSCGELS